MNSPKRFNGTKKKADDQPGKKAGADKQNDADAGGDLFDEFAADFATPAVRPGEKHSGRPEKDRPASEVRESRETGNGEKTANNELVWGWTALTAAIVSLFFLPQILGPASAVLGVVSYYQGSRTMGIWSVVIGLISLISYMFLAPYYS